MTDTGPRQRIHQRDQSTPQDPGERRALARAAAALIVGSILLELVLVLAIPIFVTTDGAAHVDGAASLVRLVTGAPGSVSRYATVSWLPATNLIPELPMAALTAFVGPETAEKAVILAYLVLLPLTMLYAVTGVRRDAGWLAVLAVPLSFSLLLHLGFYSFLYGSLGFLVVTGYHARHRGWLGARETIVLSIGLTLTYLAHAFVFVLAAALMAMLELAGWLTGRPRRIPSLGKRLVRVLVAAAPALTLGGLGLAAQATVVHPTGSGLFAVQLQALVETLTLVLQLVSFDQREAVFAILLAAVLALLVARNIRARRLRPGLVPEDGYLAFAGVTLGGVAFISNSATLWAGGPGAFVTSRLSLFTALATVLWLASHPISARLRVLTTVVAIVAAGGLLALRLPWYLRLSDQALAFTSAGSCMAAGSTVAQVNLSRFALPSRRTDQLDDEAGRTAAVNGGLDLGNAELGDQVHIVRYRPDLDPYRFLRRPGGLPDTVDPVIDPADYEASTGGRVDYVLVFGRQNANAAVLASSQWLKLSSELTAGYRRVAVGDGGLLELFERQGPATGATASASLSRSCDMTTGADTAGVPQAP